MGFFDILASVVEGAGQVGATHVIVRSGEAQAKSAAAKEAAEQAARAQAKAKGQRLPPPPKKMPWEEYGGCTPCARNARADHVQKLTRTEVPSSIVKGVKFFPSAPSTAKRPVTSARTARR